MAVAHFVLILQHRYHFRMLGVFHLLEKRLPMRDGLPVLILN